MLGNASAVLRKQAASAGAFAWLAPSLADVVFISVLILFLAGGSAILSADGDAARHLAVGSYILDHHTIPTVDVFSHTKAGQPFVPYEWLSEVLFATADRLVGLAGVLIVAGAAAAATFALLFRFMLERETNPVLAGLFTCLAAIAASIHWLARPHIFTMLFVMLWYRTLDRYHRGEKAHLYRLPLLMVLWANLHGGFLVGFVLLAIYAGAELLAWRRDPRSPAAARAGQRAWALFGVGGASLLALLINPATYRLLPHVLSYFHQSYAVDHTVEYLSPNFHEAGFLPFMLLLLAVVVVLALRRSRLETVSVLLICVFTYFALYAARNVPLFAIVVAPIVALELHRLVAESWPQRTTSHLLERIARRLRRASSNILEIEQQARGHLMAMLTIGLCAVIFLPTVQSELGTSGPSFLPDRFPVAATQFVQQNQIPGRMFNEFAWGGYLIYRLYPQYRVFIDGQTDFYGDQLFRDYATVADVQPNWQKVLDQYHVGWIITPGDSSLATLLAQTTSWRLIYHDKVADIFVRNAPAYETLIHAYGAVASRPGGAS